MATIQEFGIDVCAVTKKRSIPQIKQIVQRGASIIGENRIQEAQEKYAVLKDFFAQQGVLFHFIGHLQRNKAKKAVEMFDVIQSIDSPKIAGEVDRRAARIGKIQEVYVQVNIGREPQKHGIPPKDAVDFVRKIKTLENIKVTGLMCIAPFTEDIEDTRPYFRKMKTIFDATDLNHLSMGMSRDHRIAIEEGATMIRLGTALFGPRK